MALDIESILASIHQSPNKAVPVESWQPAHVGEIDIEIDEQANWYHEGGLFERQALVKLFSTILRVEGDSYYLVTPAEKLRIKVADVPFKIIALLEDGGVYYLISNTEERIPLNGKTRWQLRDFQGVQVPYVEVFRGLFARVDRPVFYQMVELASVSEDEHELYLLSGLHRFSLGQIEG